MLESFRRGQRWLTLIFISTIGLVFVFFFGTGGGLQGSSTPTGNAIVELDDLVLTNVDFSRQKEATEAELRAQLGDAYDEIGADRYVASQALNSLISSVILAAAADDLGLHVTKDELRQLVQSNSGFFDDQGRFDPEAFDYFAQRNYGNQRLFIQHFTRQLLQQKLIQLLVAQTNVSDSEIDLLTRYEREEVRIAYVALDATALPADFEISDAEVEAFSENSSDEIKAAYDARVGEFSEPERVKARHILILVDEEASSEIAEAARARAKTARERIVAGEDFEVVAAETSQDAGTAQDGGDLGTFARGTNQVAVDDTAFALEAGEISEVIRSGHGFHILRVDEKLPAVTPSFEELRDRLVRDEISQRKAREAASEKSASLVSKIDAGASLEDAAREIGLTLERPAALRRRPDGYVPGLGAAEDVMNAAFSLESGQSSTEIYDVGGQQVLVQVVERSEPSPQEIETARVDRREQLRLDKQNRAISAWIDGFRRRLENSGRLRINAAAALGS